MPFSAEAEQSVLGAVLIKPELMDSLTGVITADDFYMEEHAEIFRAMQGMYLKSRAIDLVTLIDELVKAGVYDEAGGREYIKLIAETVPGAANAMDYAQIVRDKSVLRALIKACDEISQAAYGEEDEVDRLVEFAEKKIYDISDGRENKSFVHIKDALMQSYDRLHKLQTDPEAVRGMPTGFSVLDKVLVGLGSADLVLIGARPGMGKTAFALNIAQNVGLRTDKSVAVFSLEMSKQELMKRLLASEAEVDARRLSSGHLQPQDWEKITKVMETFSTDSKIYIDDTGGLSVTEMRAKCKRLKMKEKNLGLIVIDYLQLMQGNNPNDRNQEISAISRGLKILAKELEVPIIALSQLTRGNEKRDNKRPMLSDLRDSGAIEQDADIVLFIHREEYYDKENPDLKGKAELIVAKNRSGPVDTINLLFQANITKFKSPVSTNTF